MDAKVLNVKLSALRPLAPVPLEPQCFSQRGQVLVALKKIESVVVVAARVDDRKVTDEYVLEISLRAESRIPTNNLPGRLALTRSTSLPSTVPALRVDKQLAEFGELRNSLYSVAYSSHNVSFCAFCKRIVEWAVWSHVEPSALARLLMNEDKLVRTLSKFVADLVDITAHCSTSEGVPCQAMTRIPPLVHEFLFGA